MNRVAGGLVVRPVFSFMSSKLKEFKWNVMSCSNPINTVNKKTKYGNTAGLI